MKQGVAALGHFNLQPAWLALLAIGGGWVGAQPPHFSTPNG